jgi:phage gpG-like protein
MFTVELVGDKEIIQRLTAMPSAVKDSLRRKVNQLALNLESRVKDQKLSGQVLNVVTGALRRSIANEVNETSTSISAKVFSSGDVKYAAIHEYGGTIHIPEIVPDKAKALHFVIGSKDIFAMRVAAHDVVMPERSYLRSSLDDMREAIVEGMRQVVLEGLRKK